MIEDILGFPKINLTPPPERTMFELEIAGQSSTQYSTRFIDVLMCRQVSELLQ